MQDPEESGPRAGSASAAPAVGPGPRRVQVTFGWIAQGRVAVGVIAIGGVSIGVVALGGVAIGVVALGGLAAGGLALGGMTLGWRAIGAVSFGWVAVSAAAQWIAIAFCPWVSRRLNLSVAPRRRDR